MRVHAAAESSGITEESLQKFMACLANLGVQLKPNGRFIQVPFGDDYDGIPHDKALRLYCAAAITTLECGFSATLKFPQKP